MARKQLNFDPGQIDQLEQSGQLTPETARRFRDQIAVNDPNMAAQLAAEDALVPQEPAPVASEVPLVDQVPEDLDATPSIDTVLPNPQEDLAPQITAEDQELAVEEATRPTEEQVTSAMKEMSEDRASLVAEDAILQERDRQEAQDQVQVAQKIKKEDEQTMGVDPKRFWKNKSTGEKVAATLAVFFSGFGDRVLGRNGSNRALDILQTDIDRDIEAQKKDIDTELALKQEARRRVELEIKNRLANAQINQMGVQNQLRMQQAAQAAQQLALQQQAIMQQRMLNKHLAAGGGVNREQLFNMDPKMQSRAILFKDGKARFATDEVSARKLRDETIPSLSGAMRSIDRLKEIGNQTAGGALSLTQRKLAQQEVQSLVGNLRLELFGPGVLTDTEQKIAREIIGNPAQIFKLRSVELAALDSLKDKLNYSARTRLRTNGIFLPKSKNEQKVEQVLKQNPGIKKANAINALKKKGLWSNEDDLF